MSQYVYTMNRVSKVVPPNRTLIKDVSLSFFPGAKIGVLGLNGAGKSTVLRIMAGVDTEFDGEARPQPGIRIGYLSQEPELPEDETVREAVMEGVAEMRDLLARFDAISEAFAEPMSDAAMNDLLAEQAELQDKIDATGGWELDRTLEVAADALRLPRGAVPAVVVQARHAAARRADQPSRRRIGGLAGTLPARFSGHRDGGDP